MTEAEKILIKHLENRKCKEHIYTDDDVYLACLDAINEALRIHDVSGQLPNNLILYRQAKKLDYAEFCKWINTKLGNLR